MKAEVANRLTQEFGLPCRTVSKVQAWDIAGRIGAVLQLDQPNREPAAFLWLPYPAAGEAIPDIALAYAGETGRHSGTYASAGLRLGEPALKLTIRTNEELERTVSYIRAMSRSAPLPPVQKSKLVVEDAEPTFLGGPVQSMRVNVLTMPEPEPVKPRREAISKAVQREVWQRDGGRCVDCSTREKLCFDHIVPLSRGGSNTVRNIQLLCEPCNLSKGNRF